MFKHEFYRVFVNKAAIFLVVAVFVINALQLCYLEEKRNGYSVSAYNKVWDDMNKLAEESESAEPWNNVLLWIERECGQLENMGIGEEQHSEYTGNAYYERQLFSRIKKELSFTLGYENYLRNIELTKARFQSMGSMVDKDSYVYRNLMKTAAAYDGLEAVTLAPAASAGAELASHSDVTDFLAIVLLLYFGITVWLKEKEQGMTPLIRTAQNGRVRLAFTKIAVFAAVCVICGICLYGTNYLVADVLYGIGDWDRPMQTVLMYGTSVWNITVGEFLILNVLFKLMAYIWVALLISMICSKAQSSAAAFAVIGAIVVISYALYYKIPELSPYVAFKYLNTFGMVKTELLFESYKGLNFFGYPYDYNICMLLLMLAGYAVFSVFTVCFSIRNAAPGKVKLPAVFKKISGLIMNFRRRSECHVSVIRHECYRIFICRKVVWVLVAALLLQAYINQPYKVRYLNLKEYYVQQYLKELSGPYTEQKKEYLEEAAERLRIPCDSDEKEEKQAVSIVNNRLGYAEWTGAYMLYDVPLNALTAGESNRKDILSAVFFMLLLTLSMPSFFAPDLQMGVWKVTGVTYKGKKQLAITRYLIGMILMAILFVLAYLPPFMQVMRSYNVGTEVFAYPANSLMHLEKFETKISIGEYLLIVYILRFVSGMVGTAFIYKISEWIKSYIYTMFTSFALLVALPILALVDFALIVVFYPYSMCGGNLFMQSYAAMLMSLAVMTAVGAFVALGVLQKRRAR